MDIIFGSISAKQRQDDIDKRQKGMSFFDFLFLLFLFIVIDAFCTGTIVELNRVPSDQSIEKAWSSKFVHLENYSMFFLHYFGSSPDVEVIIDEFVHTQVESPTSCRSSPIQVIKDSESC